MTKGNETVASARDHSYERRKNAGKGSARRTGHHVLVAQPHTPDEGPVAIAEAVAAQMSTAEHALGRPGRPVNRRSPFFVGMTATAGVAAMAGVVEMIITVRDVLVLIGLALFLAIGLEPAVSAMSRRCRR